MSENIIVIVPWYVACAPRSCARAIADATTPSMEPASTRAPAIGGDWASSAATPSISPGSVREVWNRFVAGETSWSRPWSLFVLARWCEQNL